MGGVLETLSKPEVFEETTFQFWPSQIVAHVKLCLSWNFQPWVTSPWRDRKISSNHKSRVHATWVSFAVISIAQLNNNIFSWKFQHDNILLWATHTPSQNQNFLSHGSSGSSETLEKPDTVGQGVSDGRLQSSVTRTLVYYPWKFHEKILFFGWVIEITAKDTDVACTRDLWFLDIFLSRHGDVTQGWKFQDRHNFTWATICDGQNWKVFSSITSSFERVSRKPPMADHSILKFWDCQKKELSKLYLW